MPHTIGFVNNSGGVLAHYKMLEVIRDFASGNGWQVLRYDVASADRQLILKGAGYTGEEEIFVGFRTYQNADADYYNLLAGVFTGYVHGNSFDTQPGARVSGVPAHNNRIDYWLTLNPQRIALAMKVGTPVYMACYVGKFLPYGRPSQYPYPVVCSGMLDGSAAARFSDGTVQMGYRGNSPRLGMRSNDSWRNSHCYPWGNDVLAGATQLRDSDGVYTPLAIELHDNVENVWGALDGVYYISGFGNAVENTFELDGAQHVVLQDSGRNGFTDYYALRMDS